MEQSLLIEKIFGQKQLEQEIALAVFAYQYQQNPVYQQWCNALQRTPTQVQYIEDIPFLPISFFKTHAVTCGDFIPELLFESSGTTKTVNSRHLVRYAKLYQESFIKGFENRYGSTTDYCILGLLPNYLEKGNSSLVKMVNDLIGRSSHPQSGFYLYDYEKLATLIWEMEQKGQQTLLLGVTFALMDFADYFADFKKNKGVDVALHHTIIMDTGGMKGRKKEQTREEVHQHLQTRLGTTAIHSEYGMTELLSQAYSSQQGQYQCPPWMGVRIREESDPLTIRSQGKGLINIIDLANLFSCSFIATDDVGWLHPDFFEIWGRFDHSDLRGCSLLVVDQER